MSAGMFLIDGTGRVLSANDIGARMLHHCLSIVNGRLSTAQRRDGALDLDCVIQRALHADAAERTVEIIRTSDQMPYLVQIIRFSALTNGHGCNSSIGGQSGDETAVIAARSVGAPVDGTIPHAIVVVAELVTAGPNVAPELLMSWLKLSPGEARLAAEIARGFAPREAGDRVGLTENSARVILKRVFAKAGVSSQPQLVALIGRLSGLPA